ncbi:MAG: WD40 repeat domain-containing protein, partial [Aureliella sp.]
FEWNYLHRALHHGLRRTFSHPGNEISCMSFSPDGTRLLVAGGKDYGGLFCLHDLTNGSPIFGPKTLGCNINGCAYAPDGSAFALGHGDGILQVFSAKTFKLLYEQQTDSTIKAMGWSPNSKLLVAGSEDGNLVICKTPEFESITIPRAHQGPILRLFFSHNSAQIFTSADWGGEGKMSRLWDASKWPFEVLRDYPNQSLGDIAPDGRTLAGMEWGVLHIVDANDGKRLQEQPVSTGPLMALRYVPNSNTLLVAARTDRAVQKLDPNSLKLLGKNSQSHTVSALAVDPNGKYWAAGDSAGDVRVWELEMQEFQRGLSDSDVKTAFILRDGNEVVLGGVGSSRCWSLADDSVVSFQASVGLRAMSRDGKTSICVREDSNVGKSNSVEIWRAGQSAPTVIELTRPVYRNCLTVSSSGRWLALRADEQPIELYDLSQSPPKLVYSLVGPCFQLAFSPDEKLLVGGEQHGRVIEFEVASGARLANYAEFDSWWAWGMSVAFSPDGKFLASGNESGLVRVWETESRKLIATLAGQAGEIRAVEFFPDNRRLAVGGTGDVRIWDFQSGQELLGLPIDGGLVQSLAVNEAGDTLVAVMPQGGVRAWLGH